MDKNRRFLLFLGFTLLGTAVLLAALGENRLEVYVSLFTVDYFASGALFRPRFRRFDYLGGALFTVFCAIVTLKVWEILFG